MSDQNPKHDAEEYKARQQNSTELPPEAPRTRRTPEQWQDLISQRIEEAMRQGEFDNLRGKGKPLNASPDPHVPPDMQMANSLLKNNDLVPAWIADRNAMLAAIDRLRAKIQNVTAEFREAREAATTPERREHLARQWSAQVAAWRTEIVELNKRIEVQNLKQPVTFLEILKLRLEDELRRAGAPGEW
jgi:hypothetical protein